MSKILDFVKEHPVGVAVGAAALVGGYILLSGAGASTANQGIDSAAFNNAQAAEVQAGSQFQMAQLQANQQALQSNNAAAVANNQITGEEIIAQIKSQDTLAGISATATTQQNADMLTAQTTQLEANLSAQTTQAVSLLQAQVSENQTAAAVQQTQINAAAYVNIANAPYQSADYIAALNEKLAEIQLPANAKLASIETQLGTLTTQVNNIPVANLSVLGKAPYTNGVDYGTLQTLYGIAK